MSGWDDDVYEEEYSEAKDNPLQRADHDVSTEYIAAKRLLRKGLPMTDDTIVRNSVAPENPEDLISKAQVFVSRDELEIAIKTLCDLGGEDGLRYKLRTLKQAEVVDRMLDALYAAANAKADDMRGKAEALNAAWQAGFDAVNGDRRLVHVGQALIRMIQVRDAALSHRGARDE